MPLVASLLVALPFAVSGLTGGGRHGNPASRMVSLMTQAPLLDLAPLLRTTPDALLADLRQRGYPVHSADDTLAAVARGAGRQASDVLLAVMPAR